MGKLRFLAALWAAKLSIIALKVFKKNGTDFPGKIAIKLCPDFLKYIDKPKKIIAVTGTNGKTTTSNMVCDMMELSGEKIIHNRMGSNIITGISTSLIRGANLFGKSKFDTGVFEVDERYSIKIYPYLKPDYLLVTNLSRDSLNRNAHPEFIADILTSCIPETTHLVLNGDDLLSANVASDNTRAYYALCPLDTDVKDCINIIDDIKICPECGGKIVFDYRRYHSVGKAHCEKCSYKSPDAKYYAEKVDFNAMEMTVTDGENKEKFRLMSDSIFNVYNQVSVIALFREMGMSLSEIRATMDKMKIVESRYDEETIGDIRLISQMAKDKNAYSTSRALDYVTAKPGQKEIIIMIAYLTDIRKTGQTISWIYDCDFEFLNKPDITKIVCAGTMGPDFKLRLLLAGVPEEKLVCVESEYDAPALLDYNKGEIVYLIHGGDPMEPVYRVYDIIKKTAKEKAEEAGK